MRKLILPGILFIGIACKKSNNQKLTKPDVVAKCGTILSQPTLDSFVYPTYYITTMVEFKDGIEIVHLSGKVSGDHDGSWFLKTYDKDTTYCIAP